MRNMRSDQFTISAGGSTTMPVASESTYYTDAKKITRASSISLSYKGNKTAGNLDLKIEIEQSFRPPTIEYAADTSYVVPEGVNDVATNLTATTQKHKGSLGQITLPYIRLKITGNSGNNASATLDARLNVQEDE